MASGCYQTSVIEPPQLQQLPQPTLISLTSIPNIHNPDRMSALLEHQGCVLHCFGRSDNKLNKEINRLSYALADSCKPLTKQMDKEMTEWVRQIDIAKATRRRVNLTQMDFDGILEGAVILKRYTLYLTTQISELMPKP